MYFFRIFFLFLFLIFFTCSILVSAFEVGIFPKTLYFEGKTGELICRDLEVIAPLYSVFSVYDSWSYSQRRNLDEYTYSADKFKLSMTYPSTFEILENEEETRVQICLVGRQTGTFFGVILLRLEGREFGIGTWIKVTLRGDILTDNNLRLTDSLVLRQIPKTEPISPFIMLLFSIVNTIFAGVMILILRSIGRINRNKEIA